MARKRYAQVLHGYHGEILVGKGEYFTAGATMALFIAQPEGTMGIFEVGTGPNGSDKLITSLTTDIALVNKKYYAAMVRGAAGPDRTIAKTQEWVQGQAVIREIPYVAPVKQITTVTIAGYTPAVGDEVGVKILDPSATLGAQPIPIYQYSITMKAGETVDQAITRLAVSINASLNPVHYPDGPVVVASAAPGVLTLTSADFGIYFNVVATGVWSSKATIATPTKAILGNGTYDQVAQLEREGWVDEGYATNYPEIGSVAEWGAPNALATSGVNYSFISIELIREKGSVANTVSQRPCHILLVNPASGATAHDQLKLIFAV